VVSHVSDMYAIADYALGLLEVVAAVGRIRAFEVQIAAALTRRLAVALNLAPLALITAPS
jgi:hypothetical protein